MPKYRTSTNSCFKDPDHGRLLSSNLAHTRGDGALVTLVEGFTDCAEDAALFAARNLDPQGNPLGYDQTFYDYPNQRINVLRKQGNFPFPPELKVEVENCDSYGGAAGGNGKTNFYRNGNIAIEPTTDIGGGWNVGWVQPGEWFQWQELPIQGGKIHLQVRVASINKNGELHFVIDGKSYPKMKVPDTGGGQTWTTIESAKTFAFPRGGRTPSVSSATAAVSTSTTGNIGRDSLRQNHQAAGENERQMDYCGEQRACGRRQQTRSRAAIQGH